MTTPVQENLFCTASTGEQFIGRLDTIKALRSASHCLVMEHHVDINEFRWFRMVGPQWLLTDTPQKWAYAFGSNGQLIPAADEKVNANA